MLACAQAEIGEILRRVGSGAEAERWMRLAVALAIEIGEPVPRAFVTSYLSTFLAEHGSEAQLAEADALSRTVIELAGDGITYVAMGQISLAVTCLRRGDFRAAELNARSARAGFDRIGVHAYVPHADVALLRVLLGLGAVDEALAAAEIALAHLQQNGPFGIIESAVRLQVARAQHAAGRTADARETLRVALAQLEARAARSDDEGQRQAFLSEVPEHAELRALAAALG